jgi:serine phosphatase RsbU (regulator of sigma subunit)
MLLEEREGGRRFRQRRLEIIQGVAQQVAMAIQDDRLHTEMVARERLETEVQLARSIQRTFVPHVLPQREGWQLASRWRTARQVGGDFYDVAEIDSQHIAVFVADVADKGVPAALFMALTRTLVRAAMLETDSPAEALKRVNDLLYPDTGQGMFVTGVYGVLDISLGRLTYANAGHNPPLVRRVNGTIERLVRTGVALGAVQEATVQQRSIDLGPGDCLLMFTDGLTEALSPRGEFFGDRRLEDILSSDQFGSAEGLLNSIDQRLTEFTHPEAPADDLTMVAIRREGIVPA